MVCEVFFPVIPCCALNLKTTLWKKTASIWHGLRCQVTKSRLFFWDLPNFRAHNSLFVFFKISFPPGSTFIIRYRIIMNYLCNSLSICDMICLVIIPCFFFPIKQIGISTLIWGSISKWVMVEPLRWVEVGISTGSRPSGVGMGKRIPLLPGASFLLSMLQPTAELHWTYSRVCWQLVGGNSSFG